MRISTDKNFVFRYAKLSIVENPPSSFRGEDSIFFVSYAFQSLYYRNANWKT